jgi:hypothetical protein
MAIQERDRRGFGISDNTIVDLVFTTHQPEQMRTQCEANPHL